MAQLPIDTRLKIEQAIEDGYIVQKPRKYLGLSSIGEPCARKLWYGFRLCGVEKITQRQARLFQRGHDEEPKIQRDLRRAGVICHVTQDNQPEVTACERHMMGHMDDILSNVPDAPKTDHLGEYKTHNDKSFKALKKNGMAKSKPMHEAQMITYMHLSKLKRGLYVATNKNDDERYYERISEQPERAKELISKGTDIIMTEVPPAKIGGSTWYACKPPWCPYYEICHFGALPLKNCRTCNYADLHNAGVWRCSGHKIELAFAQQQIGCKRYSMLPGLKG